MKHLVFGRGWAVALALLSVLVLAPQAGFAAVPQTINYQGALSDAGGPVNATVNMTFRLYNVETGGSPLWEETISVTVTAGTFNVTLGETLPVPSNVFNNPSFLGIEVETDGEMIPRQEMAATGYSMRSVVGFNLICVACVAEAELGFDPATQAELDTHGGTAAAHHARYTDAEAITAVGPHTTDTDTVGALSCASGEVAKWNGAAWACAVDDSGGAASDLTCTSCVDETELGFDTANQTELNTHAATVDAHHARYTDAEAVTAVGAHTVDTTLTNAEVDAFVIDSALNLFAGTTLNGAAIQTGTEADTVGALSCASGEVAKWNGAAWACAADVDTDTNTDTLAGLSCATNQVAEWNGAAWACVTPSSGGLTGVNVVSSAPTNVTAGLRGTITASCAGGEKVLA